MIEVQAIVRQLRNHLQESHRNLLDRIYQIVDAISILTNKEKRSFHCIVIRHSALIHRKSLHQFMNYLRLLKVRDVVQIHQNLNSNRYGRYRKHDHPSTSNSSVNENNGKQRQIKDAKKKKYT